jgi:hypothetical protein
VEELVIGNKKPAARLRRIFPWFISGLAALSALFSVASATPAAAQDRTFGGYECTDDCAGHKAGYDWAEANGITDPNDCTMGNSQSFYEGCVVYTEDPSRVSDEDDDGEPID